MSNRKVTSIIVNKIETGSIEVETLALDLLNYLSEDEVADFASSYGYDEEEVEEEEELEEDDSTEFEFELIDEDEDEEYEYEYDRDLDGYYHTEREAW